MQTGGAISDQSMLVFCLWAERALLFKNILGQKVQEVTGSRAVSRRSLRGLGDISGSPLVSVTPTSFLMGHHNFLSKTKKDSVYGPSLSF